MKNTEDFESKTDMESESETVTVKKTEEDTDGHGERVRDGRREGAQWKGPEKCC